MGLRTCRVISLRKAENFILSFITFFLASVLHHSLLAFPSLSLGVVRASIDLVLRKLPSFPKLLEILLLFFEVPLVEPL